MNRATTAALAMLLGLAGAFPRALGAPALPAASPGVAPLDPAAPPAPAAPALAAEPPDPGADSAASPASADCETEVRVPRVPRTASEQRIEGLPLQTSTARSSDETLRLVPGLLVVQHGSEGKGPQFFLRGFDAVHGSDVEVTLDGLPMNVVSQVHGHGYVDLNLVPPEAIAGLSVQKGPFDVHAGDFATAGALRLSLGVPPEARGVRASYEAGLTNRHRLALTVAPADAGPVFLAAEALHDDGAGPDRFTRRLSALGRVCLGPAGRAPDLLVGAATQRFGSPNLLRAADLDAGRVGPGDAYTPGLTGQSDALLGLLRWRREWEPDTLDVRVGLVLRRFVLDTNYTGWLYDAQDGDFRRQRHDAAQGFAAAGWERRLLPGGRPLTLRAGLEWRGDFFSQTEVPLTEAGAAGGPAERDGRGHEQRASAALGATWRPRAYFEAEGGLRFDGFYLAFRDERPGGGPGSATLYALSPRLTTRFPLGHGVTLFAGYGRGLRSPEARAVAGGTATNEDVDLDAYRGGAPRVTVSDTAELGLRYAPADWLELALAGFATFVSNEMVFDHVSGTNIALNATRRLGGDFTGRVRPWPWLEVRLDLAAVHARFVETGHPIPGCPWLMLGLGLAAVHPRGFRGGLTGFYFAPRPLAHGATGSHQYGFDAMLGYRWRWLEFRLSVENLTNADWRAGEYHFASRFDRTVPGSRIPRTHVAPGPPITGRLGLTVWL